MPCFMVFRAGTRAIFASLILTSLFAAGVATGLIFYPQMFAAGGGGDHDDHDSHASDEHGDEHEDEHEEEGDHVALTRQAFENLELRLGPPISGDFWKSTLVPGKVVEIPGRSDLAVSTPVAGVIESVNVVPGESISTESPLFVIRLTDEALLTAQANYLETLTRQEIAEQEIARLSPLIESGAVPGNRRRELEYEVKQLSARRATLLQELRGRGMPEKQISDLRSNRALAATLSVYAPGFVVEDGSGSKDKLSPGYSIETLLVHPGKSISRGESLCTVAYHQKLYIEGTAFEADLPLLQRIARQHWKITAEPMHESGSTSESESMSLELLRVDNHVDEATQTVRFYVELPNEVTQTLNEDQRRFEQWRFRPGQRMHLRLPMERWEKQLTLPAGAVVVDGPNVFVFAEHHHEEAAGDKLDAAAVAAPSAPEDEGDTRHEEHDEHDVFIELEPVPVRLLHRDDKTVVIADDGQLHVHERIALNNAQKLYLAMKMQAGGGGGHHHHHDH